MTKCSSPSPPRGLCGLPFVACSLFRLPSLSFLLVPLSTGPLTHDMMRPFDVAPLDDFRFSGFGPWHPSLIPPCPPPPPLVALLPPCWPPCTVAPSHRRTVGFSAPLLSLFYCNDMTRFGPVPCLAYILTVPLSSQLTRCYLIIASPQKQKSLHAAFTSP